MDAAQGLDLLRRVPRMAVPVHYDDYRVFRSPLSEFLSLVGHDEEDWRIEPPDQRARLSVELAPAAGGTLLMLTHHDVPRTLGMSYRELWQQRLRRLTEHLGVEGVPATGEVTTARHVRHVQGYPGAE